MEIPLFFKNRNGQRLFGVHFVPEKASGTGIVICQPIAEERNRTKRVLFNLGRALCTGGCDALLFDYFGEGDSEGSFEEAGISSRIADIAAAAGFLRTRAGVARTGLFGIRLGASLAVMAAAQQGTADLLIVCQPVIKGDEYMKEWMRINIASQLTSLKEVRSTRDQLEEKIRNGEQIEIEGYTVHQAFYENVAKIDLLRERSHKLPQLLLELRDASSTGDRLVQQFAEAYARDNGSNGHVLLDKTFDWRSLKRYDPKPEGLFKAALDWLNTIN